MRIKTIFCSIFFVLGLSLLIFSCKKDTSDGPAPNQVSYYGKAYAMDKAFALHFTKKAIGHQIILCIVSQDVTIHDYGNSFDSLTGMGAMINFLLYSTDSASITAGNYTSDTSSNHYRGTFSEANFGPEIDFTADTGNFVDTYGGIIFVKKDGEAYTISYNGADKSGKLVSLYFNGPVSDYKP